MAVDAVFVVNDKAINLNDINMWLVTISSRWLTKNHYTTLNVIMHNCFQTSRLGFKDEIDD